MVHAEKYNYRMRPDNRNDLKIEQTKRAHMLTLPAWSARTRQPPAQSGLGHYVLVQLCLIESAIRE